MAEIAAAQVMALRNETDLPMMECKQALIACSGEKAAALEWLAKKHKGKMEARADRETGEGSVAIHLQAGEQVGAIIEVRCETAPVAKNELFQGLIADMARAVATGAESAPSPETVKAMTIAGSDTTVGEKLTEVYGRLRETMNIGTCRRITGEYLCSYIHHDHKSGILMSLSHRPQNEAVGRDLCMHTLFSKPMAISRDDMPAAEIEKVRRLAEEMAREQGKPDNIVAKIVNGKVNAFLADNSLHDQQHVNADLYGKKKISEILSETGVERVVEMAIVQVGV
ncbi:MAG: translation elongation factor Ts [Planctomycetes bacterium]|nr:translation elongation factor Ts [Planctomycetota bacterium]